MPWLTHELDDGVRRWFHVPDEGSAAQVAYWTQRRGWVIDPDGPPPEPADDGKPRLEAPVEPEKPAAKPTTRPPATGEPTEKKD